MSNDNETGVKEVVDAVYAALEGLDKNGHNWVHHPSCFLPANVTTDWAGICWFKMHLKDAVTAAMSKLQAQFKPDTVEARRVSPACRCGRACYEEVENDPIDRDDDSIPESLRADALFFSGLRCPACGDRSSGVFTQKELP